MASCLFLSNCYYICICISCLVQIILFTCIWFQGWLFLTGNLMVYSFMKKAFFPVLSFLQLSLVLCVWLKNCGLFLINMMDVDMSIGIIFAQLMPEQSCWYILGVAFDVILVGCYGCSFWYHLGGMLWVQFLVSSWWDVMGVAFDITRRHISQTTPWSSGSYLSATSDYLVLPLVQDFE